MKPTKRQIQIAEHFIKKETKRLMKEEAYSRDDMDDWSELMRSIQLYVAEMKKNNYINSEPKLRAAFKDFTRAFSNLTVVSRGIVGI